MTTDIRTGNRRVVSVHIPKTAGTSLLKSLETGLGTERVRRDYGNRVGRLNPDALMSDAEAFNDKIRLSDFDGIECIHGHFPPKKYRRLVESGWIAITWVREPASHLLSTYRHIRRTAESFDYGSDTIGHVTIGQGLNFKDFALHPMTRNFMQRFFCETIPYAFVGITERYREDLTHLARRIIGRPLPYFFENSAPECSGRDEIDPELLRDIERLHEKDYQLYRHHLSLSMNR